MELLKHIDKEILKLKREIDDQIFNLAQIWIPGYHSCRLTVVNVAHQKQYLYEKGLRFKIIAILPNMVVIKKPSAGKKDFLYIETCEGLDIMESRKIYKMLQQPEIKEDPKHKYHRPFQPFDLIGSDCNDILYNIMHESTSSFNKRLKNWEKICAEKERGLCQNDQRTQ